MECGLGWAFEARRKGRGTEEEQSNGDRRSKDRTQDRSKASKFVSVKKNDQRRRERRAQTSWR